MYVVQQLAPFGLHARSQPDDKEERSKAQLLKVALTQSACVNRELASRHKFGLQRIRVRCLHGQTEMLQLGEALWQQHGQSSPSGLVASTNSAYNSRVEALPGGGMLHATHDCRQRLTRRMVQVESRQVDRTVCGRGLGHEVIPAGGDVTCHRGPAQGCGTGWSTILWRTATQCLHELQEMVVGEGADVLAERVAERKRTYTDERDWSPPFGGDAERNILMRVAGREDEKCAIGAHLSGRKPL